MMAKRTKKQSDKKSNSDKDVESLKVSLLNAYMDLKKSSPLAEITRTSFCNRIKWANKHHIYKCFGSFQHFVIEGEEWLRSKLPKSELAVLSEKLKVHDPNATREEVLADLQRVADAYPLKYITRKFYQIKGKYSESTWVPMFGNMSEFRRQAELEGNRHHKVIERAIAKQVSHDHYRSYFISEVLPWYNKSQKNLSPGKIKKIMVISDVHDIEADEFTIDIWIDTLKRTQPDIIVLNGDIFDLYEFSKYTKDPRHVKLKERFDWCKNFFKRMRKACPNSQIDFIMGNHEFRLLRHLADDSPHMRVLLSDVMNIGFADIFGLKEFDINWVSKCDLGAYTRRDIDNEMKQNFRIYFDCFIVAHEPDSTIMEMAGTHGHHHKLVVTSHKSLTRGQFEWVQTPGAHVKDAEYIKSHSKWNNGFLRVFINTETGDVIQDPILIRDEWTIVDGVYYERKKDF